MIRKFFCRKSNVSVGESLLRTDFLSAFFIQISFLKCTIFLNNFYSRRLSLMKFISINKIIEFYFKLVSINPIEFSNQIFLELNLNSHYKKY